MITDVYNINKLNIGSSVDFLRIKHQPTLRKGSYAFWDDDSVVKLLIKDSETYILAKKMLRKKNTSSLVRQLLFIPYFLEILNDLSEGAENEREWFEDFKNMLGYDGDELVDFDERFNFLINALGNKRENFDGLKASLKSLEKIRNN